MTVQAGLCQTRSESLTQSFGFLRKAHIKVGFKGVFITRTCLLDVDIEFLKLQKKKKKKKKKK